jgi:transposase
LLNVEARFVIGELYRRGWSISDIAARTGHDRKTVRRVLAQPLVAEPKVRRRRTHKLDPFIDYLSGRIEEGVLNARKLYGEIRPKGYLGKESQVRAFVHLYRQARVPKATVRFETGPGEQAQVDWGSFGYIEHHGHRRHLYAFVMTLAWSRAMYVEFTTSCDCAHFLRCHLHAFHYFGGVTREVLHDNLKDAVLSRDESGNVHWNPRYLDFAHYYGFTPHACQPYRAQTKGKVENGVKYVRGNLWLGLHFTDLADLNCQTRTWLDSVANVRLHATTNAVPFSRLPDEGLAIIAGKPDYDTDLIGFARVSKDCLVSFAGNCYSVPAPYHGRRLELRASESGVLTILDEGDQAIATHPLCQGYHQRIIDPAHYQSLLPKPRRHPPQVAFQVAPPERQVALTDAPQVEVRDLHLYDQVLVRLLEGVVV